MIRDSPQPDDDNPPNERLVEEDQIPEEEVLHTVLMRNPKLVPATDLGFGEVVTVGYEAGLPSAGLADLVLLDEDGRLCIVEVKKAGNPDTRKVIAQLLDYAAALWGLTIDEFESRVTRDRLGDHRGLREFIVEELVSGADEPEAEAQKVVEGLNETLQSGDFSLVVAAPEIPKGVQRVIEYLNQRGHSFFGLEVSYFAGDLEAFVPRIVVRPSLVPKGEPSRPRRPWSEPELLAAFDEWKPPEHGKRMRRLYERLMAAGARASWGRGRSPQVMVWLGEDADPSNDNPVSIGLSGGGDGTGVAISFPDVRERRGEDEMRRLAALMRALPGVAPYIEGLEERNWGRFRVMAPGDVLPDDAAVTKWVDAVVEAARPPDQRGG